MRAMLLFNTCASRCWNFATAMITGVDSFLLCLSKNFARTARSFEASSGCVCNT